MAWNFLLAFVMSVAATFDNTPRTKDWYLELLVVFSILLRMISDNSKNKVDIPMVVHILWTDKRELFLQPFPSNTMLTSGSDSQPPTDPVPGHALGSMPPSPDGFWDKLKEFRKIDMYNLLEDADKLNGTDTLTRFATAMAHNPPNLGQCAETIPYLW